MIAQRPDDAAPVIQAPVEELPLADQTVDAAMAVLTLHHWRSVEIGLRELMRVVRDRVVIVTMDVDAIAQLWIVRDYLPELLGQHAARFPSIDDLCELLPNAKSEVLPVPRGCRQIGPAAFWARPEAYLRPGGTCGDLPVARPTPPPSWIAASRNCAMISTAVTGASATATCSPAISSMSACA